MEDLKAHAFKRLEELKAQGKNPHDELRELLIDLQLEELKKNAKNA